MKAWSGISKSRTKYGELDSDSFSVTVCSIIENLFIPIRDKYCPI